MAITTNLLIDQGSDFQAVIKLYSTPTTPLDLTNYSGTAQLRKSYESTTSTATFTVAIPVPSNGEIYLTMGHSSTAVLKYGRYVYDVLITDTSTGTKTRAVEGIVTVMPSVTR
jgi:hypothetical protein